MSQLNDPGASAIEELPLPKCQQCHNSTTGIRNVLQRQHAGSILYLTTHGRDSQGFAAPASKAIAASMPIDDSALTAEESTCLNHWLRREDLSIHCTNEHVPEHKNQKKAQAIPSDLPGSGQVLEITLSKISARVNTSIGFFLVEGLEPSGSLNCIKETKLCSGTFTVDLRNLRTGIAVRDRHLRKFLGIDGGYPNAPLVFKSISLDAIIPKDVVTASGVLAIAGRSAPVLVKAHCMPVPSGHFHECALEKVYVNIRRHHLNPPSFLGIEVNAEVEISGTIRLRGT
jgi:hypothetical protein